MNAADIGAKQPLSRRRLLQQGLLAGSAGMVAGLGTTSVIAQSAPLADTLPLIAWPALTLVDGSSLDVRAWQDTAVVVVFWATWCGFCRRHNAHLEQLHQATLDRRLRVLGVCVDADRDAVRRYAEANGLHFPMVAGDVGLRAQFTTRRMVPMTGLVDRRGRRVQVIPGEMSRDDVMALATLAAPART